MRSKWKAAAFCATLFLALPLSGCVSRPVEMSVSEIRAVVGSDDDMLPDERRLIQTLRRLDIPARTDRSM